MSARAIRRSLPLLLLLLSACEVRYPAKLSFEGRELRRFEEDQALGARYVSYVPHGQHSSSADLLVGYLQMGPDIERTEKVMRSGLYVGVTVLHAEPLVREDKERRSCLVYNDRRGVPYIALERITRDEHRSYASRVIKQLATEPGAIAAKSLCKSAAGLMKSLEEAHDDVF